MAQQTITSRSYVVPHVHAIWIGVEIKLKKNIAPLFMPNMPCERKGQIPFTSHCSVNEDERMIIIIVTVFTRDTKTQASAARASAFFAPCRTKMALFSLLRLFIISTFQFLKWNQWTSRLSPLLCEKKNYFRINATLVILFPLCFRCVQSKIIRT